MSILIINAGSSSIKYSLYTRSLECLDHGVIEEITNHHDGFEQMQILLKEHHLDISVLDAIAHRVVHGGEKFHEPTLIDDSVVQEIEALIPLAPLHNPANLEGINAARSIAPNVKNFAVFDTAFHQSIPPSAYLYPIPYDMYQTYHVRRYGFHGTSHHYVAQKAAEFLGRDIDTLNLITLHLGNGASASAIQQGRCIDTSMGMTPLEGLMMGTRSGSIDPSIIGYLLHHTTMSIEEIDTMLNKKSGLLAIGGSNDMRTLLEASSKGDQRASLAIDMFVHSLKKQLGAYMAILGGVDAIIFTGGIGEHASVIREMVCHGMEHLGLLFSKIENDKHATQINTIESRVKILVIPTNEELQIATYVKELI